MGRLAVAALAAAAVGAAGPATPTHDRVVFGHSVRGRALVATVLGDPSARERVLVVGCIHGNERAGEAITRQLKRATPPTGVVLWIVDQANPDGCRAGTRQNAHGVDLNRNARTRWRRLDRPGGTYWSGPGPVSEPESKAIVRLIRRARPTVSIWYHQHARLIDLSGGDPRIVRRYSRRVGLPVGRLGPYPGSITSWQNATHPGTTAFVVELPAGRLSRAAVMRHVAAVLAVGRR